METEKIHLIRERIVYDLDCIIKLIVHNGNFPNEIHSGASEGMLRWELNTRGHAVRDEK